MTQAYNLSQLANNLNSSGQLDATDGLVNAVPVANGGTGASTASAARSNLAVPSTTGSGASGTWAIDISGNAATATNAVYATTSGNGGVTSVNGLTGSVTINPVGVGIGQTWQSPSRSLNATYTNSTTSPIQISITISLGNGQSTSITVNSVVVSSFVGRNGAYIQDTYATITMTAIIPAGSTYSASGGSLVAWRELR